MKFEIDSIYNNKVWTLVEPLERIKPIECKWSFKRMIDMEGKVVTYKVRLLVKGYKQMQEIGYDETVSPVKIH